jgi:hypothetical protein
MHNSLLLQPHYMLSCLSGAGCRLLIKPESSAEVITGTSKVMVVVIIFVEAVLFNLVLVI